MKQLAIVWISTVALFLLQGCSTLGTQPFTIVLIPDTQNYSEKLPSYFHDQTRWVVEKAEELNIVCVTHVGDIVQRGDKAPAEWEIAEEAMSRLDDVAPWGVAIGNHDYDLDGPRSKGDMFKKYFGPARFEGKPWYGGASPDGLSSYQKFVGGGRDFLIFHLESDVPDDTIAWVEEVLEANPETPAIVTTHIYMGTHNRGRDQKPYWQKDVGNSAEQVWEKLIRPQPQIFMVLCGHWPEEWFQISMNDAGQKVYEMLADYQGRENGGDGWLRYMEFDPDKSQIRVKTYSPSLDRYERDADSDFVIDIDFDARF
jgi:predicted MPP superfamily phosphohydrolase